MRATIHLVSRRDYWPLAVAIRERRCARTRVYKTSEREFERAAVRIRAFLADGPKRDRELTEALGKETWRPGVGLWAELVRVPPSGTWERRRADLYAHAEDGIELLVRRYLAGSGRPRPRDRRLGRHERHHDQTALERLELRQFGGSLVDLPRAPLPHADTPAPVREARAELAEEAERLGDFIRTGSARAPDRRAAPRGRPRRSAGRATRRA